RLVGYQLDRQMAHKQRFGRSNGCAFADAPEHVPLQRMPNVSLKANPRDVSLNELIGAVDDGIYIVGDKSWSIDMQRYNFQFTGQRFYRISGGKLDGMVRDVAYQATTTDFWRSMEAVGGPQTYVLGGAFNCGKGQPGQAAPGDSPPADDAAPLVRDRTVADWGDAPAETSVSDFAGVTEGLAAAFAAANSAGEGRYGYAEHSVGTLYLGTSAGVRLRHVQPAARVELTGRSGDGGRSAWAGMSTGSIRDVDVSVLEH